uniref:Cyclin-dependent kinases regulatory subunit n=1 Tax=Panagrolaimus davidi TaxID=227884 RepID=A0A914PKT0_9BILA
MDASTSSPPHHQKLPFYLRKPNVFPIDPFEFYYSEIYSDDVYDYRHVIIKECYRKHIPKGMLFTETEWRGIGVQMSSGWHHFLLHNPEPYILIFRRPKKINGA